jgi:hypothetical protein
MITKKSNNTEINLLSSYSVRENTVNLTTINIDSRNKGYLVDQKLIDILLAQLVPVSFNEFRDNLLLDLASASNLEELTSKFNDGVYIQTIVEKINPFVEPVASEEGLDEWYDGNGPKVIGKIDLDSSNMMA